MCAEEYPGLKNSSPEEATESEYLGCQYYITEYYTIIDKLFVSVKYKKANWGKTGDKTLYGQRFL